MGSHNEEQLSYRHSPSLPPETNLGAHVTLFILLPNSLSPPAMDQMSVSPQIHALNPIPKMWWYLKMGTLGWLGHENGALMNGISVLIVGAIFNPGLKEQLGIVGRKLSQKKPIAG